MERRAAAFVRVEQVLLDGADLPAVAWLAAQAPGLGERLARLGLLGLGAPALGVLGQLDRLTQRRLGGLACRGLSRDRVELLGQAAWERAAEAPLRPEGERALELARSLGLRVVLVSSGPEQALAPLARRLNAADVLGEPLEYRDGLATGRRAGGREPGWPARYAASAGVDLAGSYAWGSDLGDEELLRAVGFPCAVNPDARLQRLAEAEGWPVLRGARRGPGRAWLAGGAS